MNAELLAPAGNLKKLNTAVHFGADAVYFGGKEFSLRAFADNFSNDDIAEGVKYLHEHGAKAYVTANIFAKNSDLSPAREFFAFLESVGADAVIVSDMGLLKIAREFPRLDVHISTQAGVTNSEAARFFRDLGAKRIVLARELSLGEVAQIHADVPDVELECFVHGAMCVSMSGRCLLSSYFTERSSNRGECAQPCRWEYYLKHAENSDDAPLAVEEDERATYFLNSKDLCLIGRLPELLGAGVCSLKVEGRMKSEFYVATIANAYRHALDELEKYGEVKNADAYRAWTEEVSHREYTEAFFDGERQDTISYDVARTEEKATFVATVLSFEGGVAVVEMRNRFRKGDELTVLSPNDTNGKSFKVEEISLDGELTDDAKLVQKIYSLPCPYALEEGDILVKRLR